VIEPFYPKAHETGGRRPVGLERMLRIHFLQQWYALSDPAVEEALYDSAAMRRFVGIDLGREPAPDETTVCKFRHLLEKHGLAEKLFTAVNAHLQAKGFKLSQGTIVDATIVAAPSSTKNRAKARDPEMHQTRKGNQWLFGMKAHIGADQETGLVHSVVSTTANEATQPTPKVRKSGCRLRARLRRRSTHGSESSPAVALELLRRIQQHRATIGERSYTGTSKTTPEQLHLCSRPCA